MQPSDKAPSKNNQISPNTNLNLSTTPIQLPDKNLLRGAIENPQFRSPDVVLQLQQTIGNKAVMRLLNKNSNGVINRLPNQTKKHKSSLQVVQRIVGGLEDYTNPDAVPQNWVELFVTDILDNHSHLSEVDIHSYLQEEANDINWADEVDLINKGNHWDVRIKKNGITINTVPDGNCAAYTIQAILNRAKFDKDVPNYSANEDFIQQVRRFVQNKLRADAAEVKKRIAEAIRDSDNLFECGFGSKLTEALQQVILNPKKGSTTKSTQPSSSRESIIQESMGLTNGLTNISSLINEYAQEPRNERQAVIKEATPLPQGIVNVIGDYDSPINPSSSGGKLALNPSTASTQKTNQPKTQKRGPVPIRLSHRKDGSNVKVEIHNKQTGEYLGVVTIQYDHNRETVLLHTNAASGVGGQGMGGSAYQEVMTYLLENNLIPKNYTVDLSIVGGAMLHLQTKKMSERFGDINLHKQGLVLGKDREHLQKKMPEDNSKEEQEELKAFKAVFISEHLKFLDALVTARRNGTLEGLTLHAQKASKGIFQYFASKKGGLEGIPPNVFKMITDERGPNILDLLATLDGEDANTIKSIYTESLMDPKGVSVTFVMSRDFLAQFIGYGFMNKLEWLKRQYQL